MQSIRHYVRPDGSEAHRRMLPACGARNADELLTIAPDLVNCEACKVTKEFKEDEAK